MIPDGSKLTGKFLREHDDVSALIGRRVVVDTPRSTDEPWIRFTLLDATNATGSRVEHLVSYLLQLDCYAGRDGGEPEARTLALTARAALTDDMPATAIDGVVVTAVQIDGHIRLPDTDFEPARERVILTAQVWAHA